MPRVFSSFTYYRGLVVLSGILFLCVTPVFSQGIILTDNPLEGRTVFENKGCINCHSIHGIGGDIGTDLGKDPNIGGIIEITTGMWNHSPGMTEEMRSLFVSRPSFTRPEIEKLYTFLYYLRYLQTEGNQERGKRIFREKACTRCHSTDDSRSTVGPDLRRVTNFISPIYLVQSIWNHGRPMEVLMKDMGIQRPDMAENDIQDIAGYLRGINTIPEQELQFVAPGNPSDGEKIFREKKCALCHSADERSFTIGPDLSNADYSQSVSYIGSVIWNHAPQMWQVMRDNEIDIPELADQEVADIVAYIYFIKFYKVKGNAQNGNAVFRKKSCISCHKVGDEGGAVGPPLSGMPDISHALDFSRTMWNHASIMEKNINENNLPWPEFTVPEMEDLFAFLRDATRK